MSNGVSLANLFELYLRRSTKKPDCVLIGNDDA